MNNFIIAFTIFCSVCMLVAIILDIRRMRKISGIVLQKQWKIPEHPNCRCVITDTIRNKIIRFLGAYRDNYKSACEIAKCIKKKSGSVSGILSKMRKEKNSPLIHCVRIYKFKNSERESIVYKLKGKRKLKEVGFFGEGIDTDSGTLLSHTTEGK